MSSPPRVALVIGAPAPDLTATANDCARVFKLLTDSALGACDVQRSRALPECKRMTEAAEALQQMLSAWRVEEQFILYVTGHGTIENDLYAIRFGETNSFWPFPSILAELQRKTVTRAVLIFDTCHSAGAQRTKSGQSLQPVGETRYESPAKGVAILSACREVELAQEKSDGSFSVYTDLLCQAIESGLGGDGQSEFVGVEAANVFIKRKLQTAEFKHYRQTPNFTIRNAEGTIWLAKNKSHRVASQLGSAGVAPQPLLAVAVPAALVVADVIDFSFRTPDAQRQILTDLWQAGTTAPLVRQAAPAVSLTLHADRLLAVFPETAGLVLDSVLGFAWHLMETMIEGGVSMRSAVHVGQVASASFEPVTPAGPGAIDAHYFGRGINDVIRILEVAGTGEVFVSEEFARRLKGSVSPFVGRIYPNLVEDDHPIHVFGKAEVQQGVRIDTGKSPADPTSSPIVGLLTALDEAILRELDLIEAELLAGLRAKSSTLTPGRLKARISLLAPQRDDSRRARRSTNYRVAGFAEKKPGELWTLTAPGRTTYPVEPPGVGPAGRAFVNYDVIFVFGLPDYAKKPEEYIQTLQQETGLSPRTILSFGRHARSFLCLPIGLVDTSPDLVLCIDCMHPLNTIDGLTEVALMIAEDVCVRHNNTLAALWRVRCST